MYMTAFRLAVFMPYTACMHHNLTTNQSEGMLKNRYSKGFAKGTVSQPSGKCAKAVENLMAIDIVGGRFGGKESNVLILLIEYAGVCLQKSRLLPEPGFSQMGKGKPVLRTYSSA